MIILDDHCQAYIGIATAEGGIQKRIRQHWTKQKAFARLLFGGVHESILLIASFRALDTTRVLACPSKNPFALESKLLDAFPRKFLLNRIGGGRGEYQMFLMRLGIDIVRAHDLLGDRTADDEGTG